MTDALADLQQRVAALEERLDMEAGLRAGDDRELGDVAQTLRAQQHTIQALAITQSQHTAVLRRMEQGQQQIVTLLTELIDRDERRGNDGDASPLPDLRAKSPTTPRRGCPSPPAERPVHRSPIM